MQLSRFRSKWMAKPRTVVLNLILTHLRNLHQLAGRARHDSSGTEQWSQTQRAASQPALGKPWFKNLPHRKTLSRPLVPSCCECSYITLRTLQRIEGCGTGGSHGNEAPQKLLREQGRDFLRRQNRKF